MQCDAIDCTVQLQHITWKGSSESQVDVWIKGRTVVWLVCVGWLCGAVVVIAE